MALQIAVGSGGCVRAALADLESWIVGRGEHDVPPPLDYGYPNVNRSRRGLATAIEPVGLDPLALLIPVMRLHDLVGVAHFGERAVEMVAEGTGLVAGLDFPGQLRLSGHKVQKTLEVDPLHRLGSGSVDLPGYVEPFGVGIDAELDRIEDFSRIGLCFGMFVRTAGSTPA